MPPKLAAVKEITIDVENGKIKLMNLMDLQVFLN